MDPNVGIYIGKFPLAGGNGWEYRVVCCDDIEICLEGTQDEQLAARFLCFKDSPVYTSLAQAKKRGSEIGLEIAKENLALDLKSQVLEFDAPFKAYEAVGAVQMRLTDS